MPIAILAAAKTKKILEALEGNWQAEMEGYYTYNTLADRDSDPVRAQVLRHLAQAELEHATLWEGRIKELGGPEPVYSGAPAATLTRWPAAPAACAWPCAASKS